MVSDRCWAWALNLTTIVLLEDGLDVFPHVFFCQFQYRLQSSCQAAALPGKLLWRPSSWTAVLEVLQSLAGWYFWLFWSLLWMVYRGKIHENPISMDDLGVPPILGNLHIGALFLVFLGFSSTFHGYVRSKPGVWSGSNEDQWFQLPILTWRRWHELATGAGKSSNI